MVNSPTDLTPAINIIQPMNRQIPENFNYDTCTLDQIEPYLRGIVSYVREKDIGAVLVQEGENMIYDSDEQGNVRSQSLDIIFPVKMSRFQSQVYTNAYINAESDARDDMDASEEDGSIAPEVS